MNNACDKNYILTNLRRAIGQIQGVEKMIDEDRDVAEVLQQLAASNSALRSVAKLLLLNYANGCFNANKKFVKKDLEKLINQMFKNL